MLNTGFRISEMYIYDFFCSFQVFRDNKEKLKQKRKIYVNKVLPICSSGDEQNNSFM